MFSRVKVVGQRGGLLVVHWLGQAELPMAGYDGVCTFGSPGGSCCGARCSGNHLCVLGSAVVCSDIPTVTSGYYRVPHQGLFRGETVNSSSAQSDQIVFTGRLAYCCGVLGVCNPIGDVAPERE